MAGSRGAAPRPRGSKPRVLLLYEPPRKRKAYLPHMPEGSHGYVMDTAAVLPTAVRAILFMGTS